LVIKQAEEYQTKKISQTL